MVSKTFVSVKRDVGKIFRVWNGTQTNAAMITRDLWNRLTLSYASIINASREFRHDCIIYSGLLIFRTIESRDELRKKKSEL